MKRALTVALLLLAVSGCASQFVVIGKPTYETRAKVNGLPEALPPAAARAEAALESGDLADPDFARASAAIVNRWVATIPWGLSEDKSSEVKIEAGMVVSIEGLTSGTHTSLSSIEWTVPDIDRSTAAVVTDPRGRLERRDFLVARLLVEAAYAQARRSPDDVKLATALEAVRTCAARAISKQAEDRAANTTPTEADIEDFEREALGRLLDLKSLSLQLADVKFTGELVQANARYYSTTAAALRERLYSMGPITYFHSGKDDPISVTRLLFNVSTCDQPGSAIPVHVSSASDWLYAAADTLSHHAMNLGLAGEVMFNESSRRIVVPLGWSVRDVEHAHGVKILGFRRSDRYFCTENFKSGATPVREAQACSLAPYAGSGGKAGKPEVADLKSQLISNHQINVSFGTRLPGSAAKLQLLLPEAAKSDLIVVHGDVLITDDVTH